MNIEFVCIIPLLLILTTWKYASAGISPNSYFPVNNGITVVDESSFDENTTRYFNDGEFIISSSEGDKFKYKQSLIIKEDGVYVKEIYRFLKIFLFIKKEETLTYGKPLLRFPLPLAPGMEWSCEADEYKDGDSSKVKVTGKALNKEFVITQE